MFRSPGCCRHGDTVNFDGSLSVPQRSIRNDYELPVGFPGWFASDHQSGPNATVSHTFTGLGTFNVVLTVTDQMA